MSEKKKPRREYTLQDVLEDREPEPRDDLVYYGPYVGGGLPTDKHTVYTAEFSRALKKHYKKKKLKRQILLWTCVLGFLGLIGALLYSLYPLWNK